MLQDCSTTSSSYRPLRLGGGFTRWLWGEVAKALVADPTLRALATLSIGAAPVRPGTFNRTE